MYNLQGIISRSVDNTTLQFDKLGYMSTNTANYNTTAYKAVSFEDLIKEDGRLEGYTRVNFGQGAFQRTNNPLDIAICGPGFIPVTLENGKTVYTRNGVLKTNTDRYLVTNDGAIVGDGIKIPANVEKITIKPDGTVTVKAAKDSPKDDVLGKISLVNFSNPEGLKQLDGNKLEETSKSGKPVLISNHQSIKQGGLEHSNVDMYYSVNEILKLNASMISSMRILKVVDEIYAEAINLKS